MEEWSFEVKWSQILCSLVDITDRSKAVVLMWSLLPVLVSEFR